MFNEKKIVILFIIIFVILFICSVASKKIYAKGIKGGSSQLVYCITKKERNDVTQIQILNAEPESLLWNNPFESVFSLPSYEMGTINAYDNDQSTNKVFWINSIKKIIKNAFTVANFIFYTIDFNDNNVLFDIPLNDRNLNTVVSDTDYGTSNNLQDCLKSAYMGNYLPIFEQGGFNSLGEKAIRDNRVRTIDRISAYNGVVHVSVSDGYKFQIISYFSDGTVTYDSLGPEDRYITGCDFNIALGKLDDSEITPSEKFVVTISGINKDVLSEIYNPKNAVQITDGLSNTCAFESGIAYDESSALVACVSKGGWLVYGEQGQKLLLDIFPLSQPTNVRHRVAIKVGDTINSREVLSYINGINILNLGNRVWRVMFGTSNGWYYRDYYFDTDTFGDCVEIKCNFNSSSISITDISRKMIANYFGFDDSDSTQCYIVSNIQKTETGRIYMCWTGYQSHPIICYSDDDMKTLTPFSIFPEICDYEASIALIDNNLNVIARGCQKVGYSSNDGKTWTISSYLGDTNRPRLYVYNGEGYWLHGGLNSGRKVIEIRKGTSYDTAELIRVLYNSWGLTYPSLFINNYEMYLFFSDAQTTIEVDNNVERIESKDAVKFMRIGSTR